MVESHEVAGTSDTKTFLWPNGFNSGCFQLHMSQNVATLMPSLTSQSVVISGQLSARLGKLEPFTDHPSTNGCCHHAGQAHE